MKATLLHGLAQRWLVSNDIKYNWDYGWWKVPHPSLVPGSYASWSDKCSLDLKTLIWITLNKIEMMSMNVYIYAPMW